MSDEMRKLMEAVSPLFEEEDDECPVCQGSGIDNVENACKACDGTGHKLEEDSIGPAGLFLQKILNYADMYVETVTKERNSHEFEIARDLAEKIRGHLAGKYT